MSKDKISDYSSTSAGANLNTDIAGINIDEGCPPSGINNAIRALMSQIKDLQTGVSGDTLPIAAGGTGEATAASARAALGVALDADVLSYVAPGAAGNFLTSTGTDWTSAALATAVAVTSVTAGAGISLSASTGDVTITNTGVTDITAGAGISVSANTGSITISASGGGASLQAEAFASPGTWTNPGNITSVKVVVIGGGGGGGRLAAQGGGGGYAEGIIPIPTSPVTVTIGNGGVGSPTSNGTPGNTSSFGNYASATGGQGGINGGTDGTPGNGSIAAGTVLRDNSVSVHFDSANSTGVATFGGGDRSMAPDLQPAKTYSPTGRFGAGMPGQGKPSNLNAAGGVSGVVYVEFIG